MIPKIIYKSTPNTSDLTDKISGIVLHTTLGSFNGAVEWLTMSPEERERKTGTKTYSSAHAVISRDGTLALLAGVDKGTWHAGYVSKPTDLGKKLLKKTLTGYKNPNGYTIGLEFASGYDVNGSGVIEDWEKLYTPEQVKAAVWYITKVIEPLVGRIFKEEDIVTHRDITSYKPNLDLQREMVLAELRRVRLTGNTETEAPVSPQPVPDDTTTEDTHVLTINSGQSITITAKDGEIHLNVVS